jgi:hypothetical protein
VGKSTLGRVLDPRRLDACTGPRARLRVEVPAAWLAEGAEVAVTAPSCLACAHCEGGGCDGCARSGAVRAPPEAGARIVRATLPSGDLRAIAVRIQHPFGAGHGIVQLLLEVRASVTPSACVTRIGAPRTQTGAAWTAPSRPDGSPATRRTSTPARISWSIMAAAVIAAILFAIFGR